MNGERMLDLDELILRCRNDQAQQYIAEAVACYRGGAFRACIVATWVAVVFDFINKLRELELAGEPKAQQVLKNFDAILNNSDVGQSLTFEKQVLDKALKDFELISPLEYNDLKRIYDDRNRCAHPSLNSADETYQPPAELARYHIRSAVTHLLQHPPVQGKAAIDRLKREIGSEYFPTDQNEAVNYFMQGPLAKPRDSLVREFLRVLLKGLFQDNLNERSEQQHLAAFKAVRQIHRQLTEKFMNDKLSGIISGLDDAEWTRAIRFLHAIQDSWEFLQNDVRIKLENFIKNLPNDPAKTILHLSLALDIPSLKEQAKKRLKTISAVSLRVLVDNTPRCELVDPAIELYGQSKTFQETQSRGFYLLIPLVQFFDQDQIEKILAKAASNIQIKGSYGFDSLIKQLRNANRISVTQFDLLFVRYGFEQQLHGPPAESEIVEETIISNNGNS